MIPRDRLKVHRVSSESTGNGKLASKAIDGDPDTWWHTNFAGEPAKPPHELIIDLGGEREVAGIRYLARQDGGWNGAIADFEILVGQTPDDFKKPPVRAKFLKSRDPQEVTFAAVNARYLMIRVLSEVNDGPWASIAEVGVIGR